MTQSPRGTQRTCYTCQSHTTVTSYYKDEDTYSYPEEQERKEGCQWNHYRCYQTQGEKGDSKGISESEIIQEMFEFVLARYLKHRQESLKNCFRVTVELEPN